MPLHIDVDADQRFQSMIGFGASSIDFELLFDSAGADYAAFYDGRTAVGIAILRDEIERTMKLLGVSTIAELEPRHVTQLQRLTPVPGVGGAATAPVRRASAARAKA